MLDDVRRAELKQRLRSATTSPADLLGAVRELHAGARSSDLQLASTALDRASDALVATGKHRRLRTFLVRSVSVEPLLPALKVEAALHGLLLSIEVGGYGGFMDEMLNPAGPLRAGSGHDLVLLVLDLEDIAGNLIDRAATGRESETAEEVESCLDRLGAMLRSLRSRSPARIVVQNFVVPPETSLGDVGETNLPGGLRTAVRRLNEGLTVLCRSVPDTLCFSIEDTAAAFGKALWQDPRLFLSTRLAVAPAAFAAYTRAFVRTIAAAFRPSRKVLCTDLDNTLWGGVLGEDGPEGIQTGTAFPGNCYREYQRTLMRLRARGILLAVASKNNPADVEEAFRLRSADLALPWTAFTATRVGWGDKAASLREIAAELSLGLDSFVFVDDNPVECEAVRQALPEVAVIQVSPAEPWTAVSLVESSGLFDTATVTDDDLHRSEAYEQQRERASLEATAGDRDGFLASLGIVCTFVPATEAPLARAVQMLGKTNQFNMTTRRHSEAEVRRFAEVPGGQAFAIRVRDRFGDSGVVGLVLAETKDTVCRIDTLLLSCRVIGRDVETAMLAHLAQQARKDGARWLAGEFRKTSKNSPAEDFYPRHGLTTEAPAGLEAVTASLPEGSILYWYDLDAGGLDTPAFLTVEAEAEGALHDARTA